MVVQPLCELPTLGILFFAQTAKSLWSIFRGSGSLRNLAQLMCNHWHVAAVTEQCAN
jgi:hypothetical protein